MLSRYTAAPEKDRSGATLASGSRTYFPELDGVRAIAITMVILFHIAKDLLRAPGLFLIGQTGVDLFFVLSGFLITGILLKSPQNDWHEVRTFYIRRTLRIFPLYYGFLILLDLTGSHVSTTFWFYLQNIYFAVNAPVVGPEHFWSLAVEEQFYLVWPFVVLFFPRRHLKSALLLMVGLALICRFPLIYWHISPFYFTLSRVDALAAGGLLALLHSTRRLASLRWPMVAGFVVSGALVAIQGVAGSHTTNLLWVQSAKFTALATFYSTGIGLLLTSGINPLTRILRSAPLRFVGRISYGLYVFHPFVFAVMFPRLTGQPIVIRALLGVLTTFACALISWYGMERYLISLKDKLAPERTRFTPSAPPMTAL